MLLDTNAWSYLADEGAGPDLLRAVRDGHTEILVAPAVVFESLHRPNIEGRRRQISLLTLKKWRRLMPEAYSVCGELLGEIRRLHPEWLHRKPDRGEFARQRYDWTRERGGFWDRTRFDTEAMARHIAAEDSWHGQLLEAARQEGASTAPGVPRDSLTKIRVA
ncbi:hypothetical protein [Siccirubricoccus sp. G192]|uniref:hypothetical protein n=1 Tax=Siccirubricoccus sp. G192 TaxID=2849651 RepID=UPI001C2C4F63|nr:hypothetical protein [Siccirubricoccus sp. G192]MBV1800592.1 hypothetical protein [Siccirubricoccus sp. G192]